MLFDLITFKWKTEILLITGFAVAKESTAGITLAWIAYTESVLVSAAFTVFTVAVAKVYVPFGSAFHTLVSSMFALKFAITEASAFEE